MDNCVIIEDGKIISNYNGCLWSGLFSECLSNGKIIEYIQSCLPNNTLMIIPKCDGNINKDNSDINKFHSGNWDREIQPYIDYAKSKNKIFMLGTLCQIDEEPDCNYVYLPLDDDIFNYGITYFFNKENLLAWEDKKSELCWRGSCSGVGGSQSLRVRFVEKIFNYNPNTNVRLSNWWSEGKNIPDKYFADRLNYTEFIKYKIYFIVDGNCISSNYMCGFAMGCIPFLISNGIAWFSHLITPYIHYIPVNYDLSNLVEQIEWVKNNDNKAQIIAENAYKFAEFYFSGAYQRNYIKKTIENYCNVNNQEKI